MDTSQIKNWYLSLFKDFENRLNGEKSTPFHRLRKQAIERFEALNFPDLHQEDWRFTDVGPILKQPFSPARRYQQGDPTRKELSPFLFGYMRSHLVVFVNGFYSSQLSSPLDLPKGAYVGSLADAIQRQASVVVENVSGCAEADENTFTALNTAFAQDGAFIYLPGGTELNEPVHLLFLSVNNNGLIVQPRNLVITEKSCRLNLIEHYASLSGGSYFTNSVTEVIAGEDSIIDAVKVQYEDEAAYHIASTAVSLSANASFESRSISIGSSIYRQSLSVALKGEGGSTNLEGLYLTKGEQLSDTHTMIDHAAPRCTSQEHFKGILDEKSRGVFNGKILVRKGAQQTNSYQENRNVILSAEAKVDTKPQLEIFADDVKCSHGATVGQLSKESLFYLRARGIGEEQAKLMLIYAFANDVLKNIKEEEIRNELSDVLSVRFLKNVL